MIRRIDRILSLVQEPETLISLRDLGLVEKVTYSENWNKFLVHLAVSSPRRACVLAGLITGVIRDTLMRRLEEEFRREFPGCLVQVVQEDANV